MSDSKEVKDTVDKNEEAVDPEADKSVQNRRRFFTGVASALGAGIVLHGAGQLSKSEQGATEVRSRILSRIQDEIKKSQSDRLFGYDKPDNATPYGRYVKATELELE